MIAMPDQNKKENKIQQQSTSTDEKRKRTTNTQQTINQQQAAYIIIIPPLNLYTLATVKVLQHIGRRFLNLGPTSRALHVVELGPTLGPSLIIWAWS